MSNGTVKIRHSILQKPSNQASAANATKGQAGRNLQPRLKVSVAQLPPGLTETEFVSTLGAEWKLGAGKVDYFVYRHGKISKDQAIKPSVASRAYLRLTDTAHVLALSDRITSTNFQDSKNSSQDKALFGPPVVEYAVFQKVPTARKKKDPRQGTIDQDPEYMAFLESLTNPIARPIGDLEPNPKPERWTTTPLIEHIREKKARKEKPASSKSTKRDSRDATKTKGTKEAPPSPTTDKSKKPVKANIAVKEAVKVLTRQAANVSSASPAAQSSDKARIGPLNADKAQPERRRERPAAPVNLLAARIRGDLGLATLPRRAPRGQKPPEPAPVASPAHASPAKVEIAMQPSDVLMNSKREPRGRDRRNSKPPKPDTARAESANSAKPAQAAAAPTILKHTVTQSPATQGIKRPSITLENAASTGTPVHRAFLKHANESQGITEPLIKIALSAFGPVLKVEIDKRKGVAHADFATSEALTAAVAKGRVEVGNGAVMLSKYRERPVRTTIVNGAPSIISTQSNNGANAVSRTTGSPSRLAEGSGSRGRGPRGRGARGRGPSFAAPIPATPMSGAIQTTSTTSTTTTTTTTTSSTTTSASTPDFTNG